MTDDLEKYLQSLPEKLVAPISQAIRDEAQKLSNAQRAALVGLEQDPAESGRLEKSCTVVPGRNSLEVFVQAGGDLTTTDVRTGSGEPFDYGAAFEFGTTRQSARPFFHSTYQQMRDEMQKNITAAVGKALK